MRMIVVLAVIASTALLAASAAAQPPTQDSVTGTAATGFGRAYTEFTFDVHSGPSGENPRGTVTLDTFFGIIGPLDVGCLSVSANRATMFALAPPNTSGVAGIAIAVEDRGPGTDGIDWQVASTRPAQCPVPAAVAASTVSGDVVVTDAPPLPTSKDQCKKGGWREFGIFKNQGDCVSFVASKGKP
jgi:hypothetical protein